MEATAISETTKNGQIHKWPQQRPENGADVKRMVQMLDECLLGTFFLKFDNFFMVLRWMFKLSHRVNDPCSERLKLIVIHIVEHTG